MTDINKIIVEDKLIRTDDDIYQAVNEWHFNNSKAKLKYGNISD